MPWLVLAAAPIGIVIVLRAQSGAVGAIDWTASWRLVAAGALAYAVAPLMQGLSFWLVLRLLTHETPLVDAMVVWARSYVVRYAPTGALAIAYRLSARGRLRASADQVLAAYGYEHVGSLAAAAALFLVLFAVAGDLPPLLPLGIAVGVLLVTAALQPRVAGCAAQALARRFGTELTVILGGRHLAAVVALNALGWLGTAGAVYLIVATVAGSAVDPVWLLGSYAAGYLVGFVTPLSPGGLGAREGMLVVLLGPRYGTGVAIMISLMMRLANVVGELAAVTLVHVVAAARTTWCWANRLARLAPAKA